MWNRMILTICSVFVLTGLALTGDMTHAPDGDFNTLSAAGNQHPQGIWSNGTTMWVVDDYNKKIYAYNLRSKNRDPYKDIPLAYGNQGAQGIWSDGTTMWVVDSADDKIYAYNLRSKYRDSDRDISLAARNDNPQGIWSDGTTMWVTDRDGDKIYAYAVGQPFNAQAIRDFPMKIRGTTGSLKICVRDHECEDGDKIRVNVNGRSIFSGEIDNDWDCYTLDVWAGQSYTVELTALNGTGYKGDHCSHRDENTGEIRVTGENTETQVWRHRGGAGSKARIIVETVR